MTTGAFNVPFPSCCGASIVHGFSDLYEKNAPNDALAIWSKKTFIPGHVYVAILAAAQQEKYGPLLEKAEFRCVSDRTVNKNSDNRLYVWIRDPGQGFMEEKPAPTLTPVAPITTVKPRRSIFQRRRLRMKSPILRGSEW